MDLVYCVGGNTIFYCQDISRSNGTVNAKLVRVFPTKKSTDVSKILWFTNTRSNDMLITLIITEAGLLHVVIIDTLDKMNRFTGMYHLIPLDRVNTNDVPYYSKVVLDGSRCTVRMYFERDYIEFSIDNIRFASRISKEIVNHQRHVVTYGSSPAYPDTRSDRELYKLSPYIQLLDRIIESKPRHSLTSNGDIMLSNGTSLAAEVLKYVSIDDNITVYLDKQNRLILQDVREELNIIVSRRVADFSKCYFDEIILFLVMLDGTTELHSMNGHIKRGLYPNQMVRLSCDSHHSRQRCNVRSRKG
jgi:hypothetical protein